MDTVRPPVIDKDDVPGSVYDPIASLVVAPYVSPTPNVGVPIDAPPM